jgi:hypothetical protein
MRSAKPILGFTLLALLPSAVAGQAMPPSFDTLVKKGDTIIGLGAMITLSAGTLAYLGVNDSKTWMTLLTTDYPDPNRDGCILSNGFVTLREGTPLSAPAGSTLDEWTSINMTNRGDLAMLIREKPAVGGASIDGAYRNLVPIALRGQRIDSPNFGGPLLSTWDTFAVIKMNSNNEMFILGDIANPNRSRAKEKSLARYRLDDLGNILETTVLATEGMTVPAGITLKGSQCMGNNEHILSVNERGDFITFIGNEDLSVGGQTLLINMTRIVAQQGVASSVGKPWRVLSLSRVALNDRGDYVISGAVGQAGDLDGYLIEKNGQKFVQQGDVLPDILTVGAGSNPPIYLANTGDVFWHARGSGGDAFMRNDKTIVQAGRTVIGGNLVTSVNGAENAFSISRNGRFWIGNVELQSVGSTALFVDFGLVLEVPGCSANPGKLSYVSGKALVGKEFQLAMDEGQAAGASASLFLSSRPLLSPAGCGVNLPPYGELMLAPPLIGPRSLPAWDGANPSLVTIRIPNRISLVDSVFFAQGLFLSPGHPTEPFRLTNAMRIEVGPP